jgi:hypothetical protein
VSGRADDLADRLDAIAEELSELALDELKAAIGERSSPEAVAAHRRTEKRLTQARRAVEKAAHVLRRADAYTPVEDGD